MWNCKTMQATVTWCFMPSQPLQLYQEDPGHSTALIYQSWAAGHLFFYLFIYLIKQAPCRAGAVPLPALLESFPFHCVNSWPSGGHVIDVDDPVSVGFVAIANCAVQTQVFDLFLLFIKQQKSLENDTRTLACSSILFYTNTY